MVFGFFKKRCTYCRNVINGEGTKAEVTVPGYTGTYSKDFCSQTHLDKYKEEVKHRNSNSGCCG